jgi:uncharacterized membrane protein
MRSAISVSVIIDAPPRRVFAVLCDVERWPEWTSTMISVQLLQHVPFGVGSTARIRQPRLRPAVWRVTELEDGRNFTWTTRSPGLRMTAGHWLEPREGGSRVTLSFELSGLVAPLVSWLYGSMIERFITTESQGLKKRSESVAARAIGADAPDLGNR